MTLIERQTQAKAAQQIADEGRYGQLVRQGAIRELTKAEDAELFQLRERLEITVDQLARDLDTVKRAARLAEVSKDRDQLREAFKDEAKKRDAAILKLRQDHERIANEMKTAQIPAALAEGKLSFADSAHRELQRLRGENWRLLDQPNPNLLANRRHIVQTLADPSPANDDIETIELERLMVLPSAIPWRRLEQFEFLPVPGQTEQEMRALVDLAVKIARSEGVTYRYLLSAPEWHALKSHQAAAWLIGGNIGVDVAFELDVNFVAIRAPGQDPEEFEQLKNLYKQDFRRRIARPTTR